MDELVKAAQVFGYICGGVAALGIPTILIASKKREQAVFCAMLYGIKKIGQLSYATAMRVIRQDGDEAMSAALDGYDKAIDGLDQCLGNSAFKR